MKSMPARRPLTGASGGLAGRGRCLNGVSAAPARSPGSAVNYAHLADLVVNRAWKLAPGERVILFRDATRDPGMAAPLRAAIFEAGAVVEEIAAPDSRADAGLTPPQRADRFDHCILLSQHSQAAIWLPSDLTAVDEQPFEHLVEASRVRSIHFHWFLPPDAPDVPLIETMYQRDRKSTRLNSSHDIISYAVFCLKKKKKKHVRRAVSQSGTADCHAIYIAGAA